MQFLALALRAISVLLSLIPVCSRVVFLSRQSGNLSLDMRLLTQKLKSDLPFCRVVVCLTEPETKNLVKFTIGTLKQLYYARTSKVIIVDGYVPAVSIPLKRRGTTVIQMWHALGAIKKFGYQCLDTPAGRTSESARIARMHKNYDWIIAGGPGPIPFFSSAFNYPENVFLPYGLPRTDYLLDPNLNSDRRKEYKKILRVHSFLNNGKRNVLYAPTLRKGAGYTNWLSDALRNLAQRYSIEDNLIVAGHPLDYSFDEELLKEYPWIHFIPGVSTIDLLEGADVVISDYSAVIFEAGLLNKKLEYYTPDINQYRLSPGLNIEPSDIDEVYIREHFSGAGFGATERIVHLIQRCLG